MVQKISSLEQNNKYIEELKITFPLVEKVGVPLSYKTQCQTHEKFLCPNEQRDSTNTMVLLSSLSSRQGSCRDAAAAAKSLQSCPTLYDPIDDSPPTTHQTPPSLGFSRQEHRSGFPFPSPTHESER